MVSIVISNPKLSHANSAKISHKVTFFMFHIAQLNQLAKQLTKE